MALKKVIFYLNILILFINGKHLAFPSHTLDIPMQANINNINHTIERIKSIIVIFNSKDLIILKNI